MLNNSQQNLDERNIMLVWTLKCILNIEPIRPKIQFFFFAVDRMQNRCMWLYRFCGFCVFFFLLKKTFG